MCSVPETQDCAPCEDPTIACRRAYSPNDAQTGAAMLAALNATESIECRTVPIMDSPALHARAQAYASGGVTSYQEIKHSAP